MTDLKEQRITKHCPRCRKDLCSLEFNLSNTRYDGLQAICRICTRKKRKYRKRKKQTKKERKKETKKEKEKEHEERNKET